MKFKIPSAEGTRWNGPFVVCLLAIFVTVVIVISAVPGVVSAIFSPPPNNESEAALNELLEKHEAVAMVGRDRFVGRSPFFVPKRPPERPRARPVVTEPVERAEPVKEIPAGPPSSYSGPKPTSMLGEDVFFRTSDAWIRVGEEKNGVTVIQIKDPWTVTLGHKGGEYNVALWGDRLDAFFTTKYDGTSRSRGIVEDKRSEATLPTPPRESSRDSGRRGGDAQSEYNNNIPIPDPLSDQKIASMSRKESSDALKGVMAAMRRSDLDEETQKRLQHELEELRSRIRTAS